MGLPIFQANAPALDQDSQYVSVLYPQMHDTDSRSLQTLWMCNDRVNLCIYHTYLCIYDQISSVTGSKVTGKTLIQKSTHFCDRCFKEMLSIIII